MVVLACILGFAMNRISRTATKTARARHLRAQSTTLEQKLWSRLRSGQMQGHSFRRQHPIGPYFADFYCAQLKLVIELDGSQHAQRQDGDMKRTRFLESKGLRVIRFWNAELVENFDGVLDTLYRVVLNPNAPLVETGRSEIEH